MEKRIFFSLFLICTAVFSASASDYVTVSFKARGRYLNLPISSSAVGDTLVISAEGFQDRVNRKVRLSEGGEDYWVFYDIRPFRGKTLTLSYKGSLKALKRVYQSRRIRDSKSFYKESGRPQQHFSFRRGYNNDPNGLIYHNGRYHLFAQHNPFEARWENMHWGHAVSSDMVHWKELPIVLHPDSLGLMYSGSAVIDYENTSGLGKDGVPPMVLCYTCAAPPNDVQSIAYSLDNGDTFTKYEGNPVLRVGQRDPKVFWYPEGKHWVMVLYQQKKFLFFSSGNLLDWKHESTIEGFYECPDMYSLPVDGDPSRVKWVLSEASGRYLTGDFDGKTFIPTSASRKTLNGLCYAGQTISNMPDNRIVQIVWARSANEGMPFRSSFSTPMEMSLRSVRDSIYLLANPVKEFEVLQHKVFSGEDLTTSRINAVLSKYNGNDHLRIRFSVDASDSAGYVNFRRGGKVLARFNSSDDTLNGTLIHSACADVDIIIDRGMAEVYLDNGFNVLFEKIDTKPNQYYFMLGNLKIRNFELYTLDSIWKRRNL